LSENGAKNGLKSQRLVRGGAGGKVMRENEPALLVLSTYDGNLFLRKVKFYGSYILLVMLARVKYPVLPIVLQREKTLKEG